MFQKSAKKFSFEAALLALLQKPSFRPTFATRLSSFERNSKLYESSLGFT